MNDEFEKYLVFAGGYGTFNYYLNCLEATEYRNKYKYISETSSLKGFNKVGIILLYEWDRYDSGATYNWVITFLHQGSKVIGEREYITEDNWNIFEEIQNPPKKIKYTKYNRFEIMDI